MLKALELTGFKSFADKTRFEFPAGITVVVGPNGSGKSNIVDAIKWVLGEQSAKSLRGKEMADVIFKGAGGAQGRKPSNSATATIVLENKDRRFSYDADEVTVGRRVYRSGEAEYLINGESCRLKDIRNMFRGTGIGTDAYSLIEQGKVDRLLQANAKDRRAIFEEAAGISRFKAKKVEAQRRLARVEGNLIRLADIVEEVGSRYRSVKSQASKAARYKEYSQRLQELRTHVGMKDWRTFTQQLEELGSDRQGLDVEDKRLVELIAQSEQEVREIEIQLEGSTAELEEHQEKVARIRENIAQQNSRVELNRSRLEDLLGRREQLQQQIDHAQKRLVESTAQKKNDESNLQQAEQDCKTANEQLSYLDQQYSAVVGELEQLESESRESRQKSEQLVATISQLGKLVSAADSQIESARENSARLTEGIAEFETALQHYQSKHQNLVAQRDRLEREASSKDSDLADARKQLADSREQRSNLEKQLAESNSELSGKTQRAKVLQELEKRLEGVNAGAKQLLEQARDSSTGPLKDIVGVVADLVSVHVQHAGIVDVALGVVAQYLVVDGNDLLELLASEKLKVKGRVGIIQLENPPTLGAHPDFNINGQPGVIGRADRLVQVNAAYVDFVRKLLGGTWVVKTLADALQLNAQNPNKIRLVTLDGEIVEADGTVVVGPKAAATGLVSRRSELRLLKREIRELEEKIERVDLQLSDVCQTESQLDSQVQDLINENSKLASELSEKSARSAEAEKQAQHTGAKLNELRTQLASSEEQLAGLSSKLTTDRHELVSGESELASIAKILESNDGKIDSTRQRRTEIEQQTTKAKVQLAKLEQQLESIRTRNAQFESDFEQIRGESERLEQQMAADLQAQETAESEIKSGEQELALLERGQAESEQKLKATNEERGTIDARRREIAKTLKQYGDAARKNQDKIHQLELTIGQLKIERSQLATRMQDDYGIDLAKAKIETDDDEQQAKRDEIDQEITGLRRKIGNIGSVNMEALAELEDLEDRYTKMDEQYQDLFQAKESLENIISRINSDSRRLFLETLDAIRDNFQRLFRQTFGGGKADIILEEGVDPLEAGVEIVATPPGKPEFNNSLLSGGEKALTAVSLLMSIFQFRPSPFCVLDEVDAPFDEANIGRFIDVLKSFLGWTKFVIVTHSKKTMTAATTLYGVTMQESGVSKRVSVRFEDVNEDGEISQEAVNRDSTDDERGVA